MFSNGITQQSGGAMADVTAVTAGCPLPASLLLRR